jgi:hypothetical protein
MGTLLAVMMGIALAAGAQADAWLPHPAQARWQYQWSDTQYNPHGTIENVDVQQQQGVSFTLAWAQAGYQPPAAGSTLLCPSEADLGTMSFQDTRQGPVNTTWNSCPPSSSYPSGQLCPAGTSAWAELDRHRRCVRRRGRHLDLRGPAGRQGARVSQWGERSRGSDGPGARRD